MRREPDAGKVIEAWLERDLSTAVAKGELSPAFEIDGLVDRLSGLITAGRHPVLVGEPGVGKTALVYELIRRTHAGAGPTPLSGKRVLQLSLQRRVSALKDPEQLRPEMQALCEALLRLSPDVVPFFRDVHLAYRFDVEPLFVSLALRLPGPIIGEGFEATVRAMFEMTPQLDEHYVMVSVEEPDLAVMIRLLEAWGREQEERYRRRFDPEALRQALHLTHRFLTRNRQPRKALDLLGQVGTLTPAGGTVSEGAIVERFCLAHKVPRILVDREMRLDLAALETALTGQVLGQPEAIRAVVQVIGLIKAGLSDVRRPFGAFLFVGPTGVGKTHVAQLLAEYLFGSGERLIRLNMADYPNEKDALVLFGDPNGQRGTETKGVLTQRIVGQPFAVLLLDEFEKCHPKVHDRFLQLTDEGSFVNGAGESVSCRSMIIIATSNAGAEIYRSSAIGFLPPAGLDDADRELDRRLEQHFRIELLNRFDRIVHFHPLSREHIRRIAMRELDGLRERPGMRHGRWRVQIDESVVDWLVAHGYDPEYGARFLRRTIERHVATALADTLVRDHPAAGAAITLTVRQNRVVARVDKEEVLPPAPRVRVLLPTGRGAEPRSLDRERLVDEAARLLEAARPKLAGLAARRDECAALLARINQAAFWEDRHAARAVLDRFRDLDVATQIESRLARPLTRLAELDRAPASRADTSRFARSLEEAAYALREWEERTAEEGPAGAWLVVENADPLRSAADWIQELVDMEIGWCRRLKLAATVVAFGALDDEIVRAVLDVEGPGAFAYLAMEAGVHRRWRRQATDSRARIDVLAKGIGPEPEWPGLLPVRRRSGPFALRPAWRGRLELAERGTVIELLAESREALSHVLRDLAAARAKTPVDAAQLARIYGDESGGARDPRTGVSVPRLKEVLRGNLDRFLDGWRRADDRGAGVAPEDLGTRT